MKILNKILKTIQIVLIVMFFVVFALSLIKTYADYGVVSEGLISIAFALIIIVFAFIVLLKLVLSILIKAKKSTDELSDMTMDPSVVEEAPDIAEPRRKAIPPTPDDPFAPPLNGEFTDTYETEDEEEFEENEDALDTLGELAELLEEYSVQNGCNVKMSVFSGLLSAMACSHLVLVKGLDSKTLTGLISLINAALGSTGATSNGFGGGDILRIDASTYEVLRSIDSKNTMHLHKISADSWEGFMSNYSRLFIGLPTVYGYMDKTSINIRGVGKTIMNNLFFICPINEEMNVYDMPKAVADAACVIELLPSDVIIGTHSGTTLASNGMRIDGNLFSEMVLTANSEFGISLSAWKKLDRLQALLEKPGKPLFENIQLRQIERYAAALMSLGVAEEAAFDRVLAYKAIPMIVKDIEATIGTETVIADSIESIFGADSLPLTQNEIVKLSAEFIKSGS